MSAPNVMDPSKGNRLSLPWPPRIALLSLTMSCTQAIYRSQREAWTVIFVVSAYVNLLLLFWCLGRLDRDSRRKGPLKLPVWALAMALNAMFSYRVAPMLPPELGVVVWGLADFTTLASFYMLFVHREPVAASPVAEA